MSLPDWLSLGRQQRQHCWSAAGEPPPYSDSNLGISLHNCVPDNHLHLKMDFCRQHRLGWFCIVFLNISRCSRFSSPSPFFFLPPLSLNWSFSFAVCCAPTYKHKLPANYSVSQWHGREEMCLMCNHFNNAIPLLFFLLFFFLSPQSTLLHIDPLVGSTTFCSAAEETASIRQAGVFFKAWWGRTTGMTLTSPASRFALPDGEP